MKWCALLVVIAACSEATPAPEVARAPIVGGAPEAGFEALGALAIHDDDVYYGWFCSATLITPEWVITAAHCFSSRGDDALGLSFVVGSDVRSPDDVAPPAKARLFAADAVYVHPGYVGFADRDVALVHLAEPVVDVVPIPLLREDMATYVGTATRMVGFGAVEGIALSESGIKRSASEPIARVDADTFILRFQGRNVCFGDSGGGMFVERDGVTTLAGVTAHFGGCGPDYGCDPCLTGSVGLRVDRLAGWLDAVMNGTPLDCREAPTCTCAAACMNDGSCDESRCQLGCYDGYTCLAITSGFADSDERCTAGLTSDAKEVIYPLWECVAEHDCNNAANSGACVGINCENQRYACEAAPRALIGELTCGGIVDCWQGCPTWSCLEACYFLGSADALPSYAPVEACMIEFCWPQASVDELLRCMANGCKTELDDCAAGVVPEPEPEPEVVEEVAVEPVPEVVEEVTVEAGVEVVAEVDVDAEVEADVAAEVSVEVVEPSAPKDEGCGGALGATLAGLALLVGSRVMNAAWRARRRPLR